jgi:hypothetical protein
MKTTMLVLGQMLMSEDGDEWSSLWRSRRTYAAACGARYRKDWGIFERQMCDLASGGLWHDPVSLQRVCDVSRTLVRIARKKSGADSTLYVCVFVCVFFSVCVCVFVFQFDSFRFISFRFVRFSSFRFRFVSFRFHGTFSFRLVSVRFVSFRFVSSRFALLRFHRHSATTTAPTDRL